MGALLLQNAAFPASAEAAKTQRLRKRVGKTPVSVSRVKINRQLCRPAAATDKRKTFDRIAAGLAIVPLSAGPAFAAASKSGVPASVEASDAAITLDWPGLFQLATAYPWVTLGLCGLLAWGVPVLIRKFLIPLIGIVLIGLVSFSPLSATGATAELHRAEKGDAALRAALSTQAVTHPYASLGIFNLFVRIPEL